MNIGELIKSVMTTESSIQRPEINYNNFRLSPWIPFGMDDEDYQYANLIDVTTREIGFSIISKKLATFEDLKNTLVEQKQLRGMKVDLTTIEKEVLTAEYAFEVTYKYEGIGYIACL